MRLWILIPVLLGGARVTADTIVLKNGNRIQGEIIEETSQRITVRFFGGTLQLKVREVASIERESRLRYLLDRGEVFFRRNDPKNSISAYEEALKERPDSKAAFQGLLKAHEKNAALLAKNGLFSKSIAAYEKLLELAPDHPRACTAIEKQKATIQEGATREVLALEALREGAVDKALLSYRELYQRFPERRLIIGPNLARALIRKGNLLLQSNRLEEAESHYLEAVSLEPDLVPAMVNQFLSARVKRLAPLASSGEFEKLLSLAEEGLQVAPESDILAFLAALGQEGLGRKEEAAEGYLKVSGIKAPRNPVNSLDELRKAAEAKISSLSQGTEKEFDKKREEVLPGEWREIKTEYFLVHHRNAVIGSEVAQAAEAAYQRIHNRLSLKSHWRRRCVISIFPTKEEFQETTGQLPWTGGSHEILQKMGVLTDHRIYSFQTQPRLSSAVIPHEVAHAMLAFAVGYRHRAPLWLSEGFAISWEPAFVHRYYRRIAAHAARTRSLEPLSSILRRVTYPEGDEEVRLFYAQSYSLIEVLLEERGIPELVQFARELAASPDSIDTLLDRFFAIRGQRALENRWIARLVN